MPLISVVMPTYNASVPILKEAVDSVLDQSFRDFEFIIIDDGSTDGTPAYLDDLTDPRVKIIRNPVNIGITKSLNVGFREAEGKYIARMDSDDVCMPDRFEKQFAFMEDHPDTVVCGSLVTSRQGELSSPKNRKPEDMESYRIRMLFSNPGPFHPTAFFRREVLVRNHIAYDEDLIYAQDYGMWAVLSRYGRICILPETLLFHRLHTDQISQRHRAEQIRCDKMTQKKLLSRLVGSVSDRELDIHYHYSTGYYRDVVMTGEVKEWYSRLLRANARKEIYDRKMFSDYVYRIMLRTIWLSWQSGITLPETVTMVFRYLPLHAVVSQTAAFCMRRIADVCIL